MGGSENRSGLLAAWVIILLAWLTERLRTIIIALSVSETLEAEIPLGQQRMVPQQSTDTNVEISHRALMFWQERRSDIIRLHNRLQAGQLQSNQTIQPESPRCQSHAPVRASADASTQTLDDDQTGTVVDTPPVVSGSMDGQLCMTVHGNGSQPTGEVEVPEEHPAATAVDRGVDSGIGHSSEGSPPDVPVGGLGQEQTVLEVLGIGGESDDAIDDPGIDCANSADPPQQEEPD